MSRPLNLDKNLLYDLYIKQGKSGRQIGKILSCSGRVVHKYLNKYQIPARPAKPYKFGKGKNSFNWQGGRLKKRDGYVLIYSPNRPNKMKVGGSYYMYEHRLVMEKHLGRYLENWETVHHINGIRDDNRIENLQLLPKNIENIAIDRLLQENRRLKKTIEELRKKITNEERYG